MRRLKLPPAGTKHRQLVVRFEYEGDHVEFDCDVEIAELIGACWCLGMPTLMSCQDMNGQVWIQFSDQAVRERFESAVALDAGQFASRQSSVRFNRECAPLVGERLDVPAVLAAAGNSCRIRPKGEADYAADYAVDLRKALTIVEGLAERTYGAQSWLQDERDWPMLRLLQHLSGRRYGMAETVEQKLEELNDCIEDLLEDLSTEVAAAEAVARSPE